MATILDTLITRIGPQFINRGELRKLESGVARVQAKLNGLATGFAAVGTTLTAGLAATIKPFAAVERKFAEVEGLVGVSRDQINAWEPELNRIGRAYGQVPEKMADALFFLTSAGLKGDAVLQALEGSAKGSAAGLGEIETIANLVTGAMEVMGIGAAEALDIVTATIREGKLDPASLTGPLGQVLPFAGEVGATFDEVGGIMAVLSRRNFDAARSSTALRGIFAKLIKPTEQGKKELEKYGLTFGALREQIESQGLLSALETLNRTFAGDTEGLGKVFEDVEGLAGFLAIFSGDIADVRDILDSTADSAGDLDAALKPIKDTISFRWDQALAGGMQVLIDLGERSKDFINDLFDIGEKAIDTYLSLNDAQKSLIARVLTFGPALLAVGAGLKGISIAIGWMAPMATAIAWIGEKTRITAAAQAVWNARIGSGSKLAAGLSAAMLRLQAVGTAAAVALNTAWARLYLTLKFGGVKGLFLTLWASISAGGIAAFAAVRGAAATAYAGVRAAALATIAPVRAVYAAVALHGVFGAMRLAGIAAFGGLKVAAVGALSAIKAILIAAGAAISTLGWPVILTLIALAAVLLVAWRPVSTFFRGLWSGVADNLGLVSEAFGRLIDALGPVGGAVRGVFGFLRDALGWLMTLLPDLTAEGESFGAGIVNGLVAAIDAVTALVKYFRELFGLSLFDAGAKLMSTLVDGIKATAGMAKDAVLSALSGIRDLLPFSDAREGPLSRLTQSGRAIVTTIAEGVQSVPTTLTDALREALPDLPELAIANMPNMPDLGLPSLSGLDLPALDALAPPLPIGPVPPPAAAASGPTLTVTLAEGAIVINAPGGDADQIAERIGGELENQWRALAEQADSRFRA